MRKREYIMIRGGMHMRKEGGELGKAFEWPL